MTNHTHRNSATIHTGRGAHRYRIEHDWLTPPWDMSWGDTQGLCQDSSGRIYVGHTVGPASMRSDAILVFDAAGRYLCGFGGEFRGGTHGLACRQEPDGEYLYVTDTIRCQFAKLTLAGEVVWRKAYPLDVPAYAGAPRSFCPTNFAFAPNGDFFLADGYGSHFILRYDRHGNFLAPLGRPGTADGEFREPHGLWVDTRGDAPVLVVADRGNSRLQVLTLEGRHLRTVQDSARLQMPCHFDQQGEWLVCPDLTGQVCLLDRDFQVAAQLGDGRADNAPLGSRRWQSRTEFPPGKFIYPHAAIFLRDGSILVAEWVLIGRITRLIPCAADQVR
ncbi:MAG: hypothetical protein HYV95_05400 [Opitutae bacterium]|nr:hypothetical protein [Opitutae bacterium]